MRDGTDALGAAVALLWLGVLLMYQIYWPVVLVGVFWVGLAAMAAFGKR